MILFPLFRIPFVRATPGLAAYRRGPHRVFVCNHVSLLDTIFVASVLWSHGRSPILVLGDASVWRRSALSRFLSSRVGYLLERGRLNKLRIQELRAFGASVAAFELLVFPEGTRGDGLSVKPCQPGIFYIAREARAPIVPVFIENMQLLSTKTSGFHPLRGLRKVVIRFGAAIEPEEYLELDRADLTELVRRRLEQLAPGPPAP
ncbi:MAG: 1-acyl-sn-glycerol-3-phosphate acyltransferase [Acidobacteria bacterium]|nr:1-acyl-sn-glycerol-3-phosphate acyltransferase [Acidobacteriota bacterium]